MMRKFPLLVITLSCYACAVAGDGDIDRPCDLLCLNGGSCQLSSDAEVSQLGKPSQYCDCPEGYGGITCEYVAEQCGFKEAEGGASIGHNEAARDDATAPSGGGAQKKRYCMHGAPCKVTVDAATGKQHHTCDCSHAIEAGAYAGDQCEHAATVYCREGKVQRTSFCVNGGTCRVDSDAGQSGHVGCDCTSAFDGEFCEFELGLNLTSRYKYEAMQKPKSEVAGIVYGAVLIAMLSGVVFAIIYVAFDGCRTRRRERSAAALNESTADLALDPDGGSLIGEQLEDNGDKKENAKIEFA